MEEHPRFDWIQLVRVGPFNDIRLNFEPGAEDGTVLNIFTGVNGSGKTTVLEALAQVLCLNVNSALAQRLASRFWDAKSIVRFSFGGEVGEYWLSSNRRQAMINNNSFSAELQGLPSERKLLRYFDAVSRYQRRRTEEFDFAAFAYSGRREFESVQVKAIQDLEGSPFVNALNFDNAGASKNLVQWVANTFAKSALIEVEGRKDEADEIRWPMRLIERFISELSEREFRFVLEQSPFDVRVELDGKRFDWSVLPDGIKSEISWLADLLLRMDGIRWSDDRPIQDRRFLLFLDEIDIHLHPAWQRRILPLVPKIFRNAQVFVSTHSPFVVGSAENAYIYKFDSYDGVIKPAHGSAGMSLGAILDDSFDVPEEFDERTEELLIKFRAERDLFMKDQTKARQDRLSYIAQELSERGPELQDIVSAELVQIKRHTGVDLRAGGELDIPN